MIGKRSSSMVYRFKAPHSPDTPLRRAWRRLWLRTDGERIGRCRGGSWGAPGFEHGVGKLVGVMSFSWQVVCLSPRRPRSHADKRLPCEPVAKRHSAECSVPPPIVLRVIRVWVWKRRSTIIWLAHILGTPQAKPTTVSTAIKVERREGRLAVQFTNAVSITLHPSVWTARHSAQPRRRLLRPRASLKAHGHR